MNLKRLLPIYLGAIIGPMGGVGIITLLPVLCRHFDISIQWASLTVTLYMIPYVVFQLFSGSIAQVFDTRRHRGSYAASQTSPPISMRVSRSSEL